jgi:serine/threonine protein kinase
VYDVAVDSRGEEFGPYLVYEQIGIGGMASVHRAETTGLAGFRRPVALKRMLPHVAANDDLVQSFVREARLASYLRHANVAQTYDLGKVGDIYFIAMELVPGRNLREILKQCLRLEIHVPIPIALNILNQVCDALDYAHNLTDEAGKPLGIIHRDVSPSNVIVSETGVCKLIDFGIAKASANGMQTLSGTIKGKFGYMAPEYLGGTIDARADLFALGIIAHELLTNRPLFGGRDDMDTLYRVKSMKIKPPSQVNTDVPPEIDAIVMTALERDPDSRWQRASALRVALTTETKRLGLAILDHQVVDWCEQVFARKTSEADTPMPTRVLDRASGTSPSIVIERFDHPELDENPDEDLGDDDLASTRLRGSSPEQTVPQKRSAQLPLPAPPTTGDLTVLKRPPQIPLTGSRTLPKLEAQHTLSVSAEDVLSELNTTVPAPRIPNAPYTQMSNWLIALLLLVAATAAGAVVYFGLPYIQ